MCERFGQRPSDILGVKDRFIALDFDMAVHFVYGQITKKYMDKDTGEDVPDNETTQQRTARIKAGFSMVSEMQKK